MTDKQLLALKHKARDEANPQVKKELQDKIWCIDMINSTLAYNNFQTRGLSAEEVKEWRKKITSIQDNISDIIAENINDKNDLLNYINEVKIVGFVMGNKIENLKDELIKFNDFSKKNKISVYMITIPLESKDSFVEACHKVISDMKKEVESHE